MTIDADAPCTCVPGTQSLCSEALGLLADVKRAAAAGQPGSGVTTTLGSEAYGLAQARFQQHLRAVIEYYLRQQ